MPIPNQKSVSGKAGDAPAFPFILDIPNPIDNRQITRQVITGLSIRDYFAAKAMQGFLSPDNGLMIDSDSDNFPAIASDAYRLADAMITAREIKPAGLETSQGKNSEYSNFHGDYLKPLL